MVTDFQHTVSLPQRLLHFIILSICRCYLIRDFFDVAVRIQQIDQFTVDLRHITVDLIDIELCRIGNIFICQLAVFPNAPEQADNKPHQDQKNRSSKPQGRILQTAYSNAMQHPSFSFLPEIHKRIHPSFFLSAERLPDAAPYRAAPAVLLHSRNIFAAMFFVTQPIISHFFALSMQSPCFTWREQDSLLPFAWYR